MGGEEWVLAWEWLMTCCRGACCAAEDGVGFADNLLHTLILWIESERAEEEDAADEWLLLSFEEDDE